MQDHRPVNGNLGRVYYGSMAGLLGLAVIGVTATGDADAGDAGAQPPMIFASGYGVEETRAPRGALSGKASAIDGCLAAANERIEGDVELAAVNRARLGTEGWIVDLSLDVLRDGKAPRRRDIACRASRHGLQVARY